MGLEFETFAELMKVELLLTQQLYVQSDAKDTMICTGVGSGKTFAICFRGILLTHMMPGNQGLITTDTETHLEDTTKQVFFEMCPPDIIVKVDNGHNLVQIKTRDPSKISTIYFRHLNESRPGRKHLSGLDLGWYSCDQLEDCEKREWDYLMTRLRRPGIDRHYRFAAMNAKGKDWCYKRYFQPAIKSGNVRKTMVMGQKGEPVEIEEYRPAKHRYAIIGPSKENIHLPPHFIQDILETQTQEYIDRYVHAKFEDWAGKIYKDFSIESAHNIHWFKIPETWPCIVSIDVGGDSPWAILVGRRDPIFGDVYITAELFAPGLVIREIVSWLRSCEEILSIRNTRFICDPANKLAIVELFEHDIYCEPARKGPKLPGILRVGGYMKPKSGRTKLIPAQPHPDGTVRDLIVENAPTLWVFKDRCPNFVREHDEWVWHRDHRTQMPTNKPVDVNDHTCDANIYLLRIMPPIEQLARSNPVLDNLRKLDPLSWKVAKQAADARDPGKHRNTGGEAWMRETGETDGVYKDVPVTGVEW